MNNIPEKSCFICATPRTGSTLLCAMLQSTGISGNPESYFREQDEQNWAARWHILQPDGTFRFSDYLESALKAGKSQNGIFAARIMWGTMNSLVSGIKTLYPHEKIRDTELLTLAFGPARFIYLKRADTIAQAVSRLRAEQTNIWHITNERKSAQPDQKPQYNFERIHHYILEAKKHNAAWETWFHENGITPYPVLYEDLNKNPVKKTQDILDFLDLDLPENTTIKAENKRMADATSKEWIERYISETKT